MEVPNPEATLLHPQRQNRAIRVGISAEHLHLQFCVSTYNLSIEVMGYFQTVLL